MKSVYRVKVSYPHNDRIYYAGQRLVVTSSLTRAEDIAIKDVKKYREKQRNFFGDLFVDSIEIIWNNVLVDGEME